MQRLRLALETAKLDGSFDIANNRRMEPFAGIEAFVRVIEDGGFTAAAARLQTAKSSVSEAVRSLEERLGVRLLDRTTRRVRPTDAGLAFYRRCRRLMDDAESARAEIQIAGDAPSGLLRVTTPDGFAARFIIPSLGEFLNAFPAINLELVETQPFARLVDEGLDLAIRITSKPDENLIVRKIGFSRTVMVAAPSYLAGNPAPKSPAEIQMHQCVGFSPLTWRDAWPIGGETIAVKPRLLTNSTDSLRSAALAGLGLVVLPEWFVADALASGTLNRVLPGYDLPASAIYAAYPSNRLIPPKVRVFVDYVADQLKLRGLSEA